MVNVSALNYGYPKAIRNWNKGAFFLYILQYLTKCEPANQDFPFITFSENTTDPPQEPSTCSQQLYFLAMTEISSIGSNAP